MPQDKSRFVVSADWVEKNLGSPEFRILDASWYLPAQKRDAAAEYADGHLPGAVFFDQDAMSDQKSQLPHTIAPADYFAAEIGKLGIAESDTIVVYDGPGFFSAPRAWFLLRLMGAEKVYVMEGGLDGWKRQGRPLSRDLPEPAPAKFTPRFDESRITSFAAMRDIVDAGTIQIADARAAGRFTGDEPEPRAGMRSGHMPGAKSLPFGTLLADGNLKTLTGLRATFAEAGIDLDQPVVTTCGSGITAAVITLALESLGHGNNTLYDGSWAEWGGREDTPIATGKSA